MSLEQNKAIVLQFYKAYNQGNLEQAKELIAPNIVVHTLGTVIHGGDDFFEHMQKMRSTFPDSYHTFEDVIAEDDKVVTRGTFTGTHRLEFLGIPPTSKQVTCSCVQVDRLADGKIVDHWVLGDSLAMLQQLGKETL
ncbi:ester cyclase [Nostocaceae cyanobacterium CENA369]|uniref:Ester cyclase n=1 Tax=Dendronalium phyllosphericum CENA369 TaxID=1725256 RepID=A0A8J7IRI6_9NOST|nr:ester cyclase [Dendronalium phyllosphericum]MBH8577427.1 ester cyclase [Dendronalium phyllosphericum CENA369]